MVLQFRKLGEQISKIGCGPSKQYTGRCSAQHVKKGMTDDREEEQDKKSKKASLEVSGDGRQW